MNSSTGSEVCRGALVALIAVMVVSAVMAQTPPPPVPAQPYPNTTPAIPVQTPGQAYPSQVPAYPAQNPAYPNPYQAPATYPGQVPSGYPLPPAPAQSHFFRDLFAQTIAAVLQTSTGGLLGAITGRIMEWFSRKGANPANANAYATQYPNTAYPVTAATPYPSTAYPTTAYGNPAQAAATYPGAPPAYPGAPPAYPGAPPAYPGAPPAYPGAAPAYLSTPPAYSATPAATPAYSAAAPTYPSTIPTYAATTPAPGYAAQPTPSYPQPTQGFAAPTQVYDARTGQLVSADANPYATRDIGMAGGLYAGIAYEVHTMGADGAYSTPVNTATYEFHTGDRFMVYYRPSLPGHMEIYNINGAGKQTLIDSSNMAAGQMVALGPYEFTNDSGEESLHLVLSPCTSPQLITATRDIVKVGASPQSTQSGSEVRLGDCGPASARGTSFQTRDIAKVGVEGTTSFALDPISPKELRSGQVTPRQMTIVFHHH
jgi:hypothetical protein